MNYPSPFTTPGAVVSNFPPSGSLFPAGTTVVSSTSIYDTNILHCTFLVTVLVRPTILVPPQNVVVSAGASTNFAVTAEGSAPLSYQWSFEGVPIAGATNATLIFTNAQPSLEGYYDVRVTNAAGSISSLPARLRVLPTSPIIVSGPTSAVVSAGTTATLEVVAGAGSCSGRLSQSRSSVVRTGSGVGR